MSAAVPGLRPLGAAGSDISSIRPPASPRPIPENSRDRDERTRKRPPRPKRPAPEPREPGDQPEDGDDAPATGRRVDIRASALAPAMGGKLRSRVSIRNAGAAGRVFPPEDRGLSN